MRTAIADTELEFVDGAGINVGTLPKSTINVGTKPRSTINIGTLPKMPTMC